MPKTAINYLNTIIYKLVHKEDYEDTNVYIGSTSNFIKRRYSHKSCCLNKDDRKYNMRKYQYIRANGGWEEWNMIEVEKYPCVDKREAESREEYWRKHFNAKLNTIRAFLSEEEQVEVEKIFKENKKKKYLENREEVLKDFSKKITCECGHIGAKNNISRHIKTQKHLDAINTS